MSKKEDEKKIIDSIVSGEISESPVRNKYNAKASRSKYDDVNKRKQYKESQFGDKQTIQDEYTGKTLHKDTSAARRKYGSNKYNEHTSQTDHTVPIKKVVNQNKSNRFLTDSDIKEIANIEENYKITSGRVNQSKGSQSNKEHVKKNKVESAQAKKMIKSQKKAEVAIAKKTTELTVKGINKTGLEGAAAGAKASVVVSSAKNIKKVMDGEENAIDAVCNVAIDTAEGAARGYSIAVVEKGIESGIDKAAEVIAEKTAKTAVEKAGEEISKELGKFSHNTDAIGKIIVITMEIKPIVDAYCNGEIDNEIFIEKIEDKGAELAYGFCGQEIGKKAGGAIGGTIGFIIGSSFGTVTLPGPGTVEGALVGFTIGKYAGEFVGAIVGYMVGTAIYARVKENYTSIADLKHQESAYRNIERKLGIYTKKIEKYYEDIGVANTQIIINAFEEMKKSIIDNDVDKFTYALQHIADLYGSQIRFVSNQQFIEFWNDPNAIMEI